MENKKKKKRITDCADMDLAFLSLFLPPLLPDSPPAFKFQYHHINFYTPSYCAFISLNYPILLLRRLLFYC